ncbi:INO80 complex subunit C-like protein [Dinothrombium tinctorium]|uniref:INO80 complex subunit C-like protein n=1 Tax=Dinothrombium tinctorium TaxID=1965070 RepID=A0A3S3PE55_9ACAR|nr:INO80 complex subunit C-like protein [Dinothrombium tinctorium]
MVKKKKSGAQHEASEESGTQSTVGNRGENEGESKANNATKTLPFKNANFVYSKANTSSSKKSRGWKTLKQVIGSEKPQPGTGVTYASIDAPFSRKPFQKYSDLSGLPARYRDPGSKLYYFNCDEYAQIKMLTADVINGYLELRKENP